MARDTSAGASRWPALGLAAASLSLVAAGCTLASSYASARPGGETTKATVPTRASATPLPPARAVTPATRSHLVGLTRWAVGKRSFLLYVPRAVRRPAPLVVALGGLHWSADMAWHDMRIETQATRIGAVVVYPEPVHGEWDAIGCCDRARADDVAFLRAVRRTVGRLLPVNQRREVLLGFSDGGMLAYLAACQDPGWTSIITFGATLTARCRPAHPFAITNVNGMLDTTVPWDGGYSGYTQRILPSVWQVDAQFAAAFRCAPARQSTVSRTVWWVYAGCANGVSVRDARVPGVGHHWALREKDGWDIGPVLWRLGAP